MKIKFLFAITLSSFALIYCRFGEKHVVQAGNEEPNTEKTDNFLQGKDYDLYSRVRIWDSDGYATYAAR